MLHTTIEMVALWSAISSLVFAAAFIAWLEIYSRITQIQLEYHDPASWVPRGLLRLAMAASFTSSIATVISIWL